jgi:hypothetical protein
MPADPVGSSGCGSAAFTLETFDFSYQLLVGIEERAR